MQYVFTSERLGFRNWRDSDLDIMAALNADKQVMEFFPSTQDREVTRGFIQRMQTQFDKAGYCYFAVDTLHNEEFIGFIGIMDQSMPEDLGEDFAAFVDIGWRLKTAAWGKGYATEGARACLDFGYNQKGLKAIYSIASQTNVKSISVMKKVGMQHFTDFVHPKLKHIEDLKDCVLYRHEKV